MASLDGTHDTAVRNQTTKVQTSSTVLGIIEGLGDNIVLVHLSLLDGLINAYNILPDNTSSANVQVADLRVSHESLWEADSERGSLELSESVGMLVEVVHNWSLRVGNGITILWRLVRWDSPSIDHDCNAEEP